MWSVSWSESAIKNLAKLDKKTQRRIAVWAEKLLTYENPRQIGTALQGKKYRQLWRYRVGSYRLICQIQDAKLIVLVVGVGHRSGIY